MDLKATSCAELSGLITSVITPLNDNGKLDEKSLSRLLEALIDEGNSLLLNSIFSGEGAWLLEDEKKKLIKESIKIIHGRVNLILGITGNSEEETLQNASYIEHMMEKSGYDGRAFLFDCPLWYHSNRGLPLYYEKLCKITRTPILLSNNPSFISKLKKPLKRYNIRTGILKRITENPQILGLEHSGTLKRFMNYTRAARTTRNFLFYDGNELNFLNSPSTCGVISIGANVLPRYWKEVAESSLKTDDIRKEEENYRRKLCEAREKLENLHRLYKDNPVSLIKTALKHSGIIASDTVLDRRIEAGEEQKKKICSFL